jgi:hypothetical protein
MVPFREIQQLALFQATKFLQSYLERDTATQAHVRYLLPIVSDPNTNECERERTMKTLYGLLFPHAESPWEGNGEAERGR